MTRQILESVFFGREDALERKAQAHQRLDEAFTILSGLQQPNHPTSEKHAKECEEARRSDQEELRDAALDVLRALGVSLSSLAHQCQEQVRKGLWEVDPET